MLPTTVEYSQLHGCGVFFHGCQIYSWCSAPVRGPYHQGRKSTVGRELIPWMKLHTSRVTFFCSCHVLELRSATFLKSANQPHSHMHDPRETVKGVRDGKSLNIYDAHRMRFDSSNCFFPLRAFRDAASPSRFVPLLPPSCGLLSWNLCIGCYATIL